MSYNPWRVGTATLNFGAATTNNDVATVVVSVNWVNANSKFNLQKAYLDTSNHLADEILIEEIQLTFGNIIPNVSFEIKGYAPNLTYGEYYIVYTCGN